MHFERANTGVEGSAYAPATLTRAIDDTRAAWLSALSRIDEAVSVDGK